jgi:transcription elongation factor Elf1
MVYENCNINGPYLRKDGRMHMVIRFPERKLSTVSYPKYLMEQHLGRYLTNDETVDHIDRDFTNNNLNNLQILNRKEHTKLDIKYLKSQKFNCLECGNEMILDGKKLSNFLRNSRRKNVQRSGSFCCKKCVGLYGSKVQNNVIEKLVPIKVISEYMYLDKNK